MRKINTLNVNDTLAVSHTDRGVALYINKKLKNTSTHVGAAIILQKNTNDFPQHSQNNCKLGHNLIFSVYK